MKTLPVSAQLFGVQPVKKAAAKAAQAPKRTLPVSAELFGVVNTGKKSIAAPVVEALQKAVKKLFTKAK